VSESKYGARSKTREGLFRQGPCPSCGQGCSHWECEICEKSGCELCSGHQPRAAALRYEGNWAELPICAACRRGDTNPLPIEPLEYPLERSTVPPETASGESSVGQ